VIELRHIRKEFEAATPLQDVNATINEGDIIAVIGPSGTGKSTLLRCINLLDKPTSGQVFIHGEDVTAPDCKISEFRKKVGMVFQNFNLFGHLTVLENVMIPVIDLLGLSRQEACDRAMRELRLVGMNSRALDYPEVLSGGQKQRVAIARTLAMDPEIILFDEPTSALDPTMVGEVQSVIRDLARMGKTMMIVTHEMRFAREISNRVFYLDEGGIYEEGTPEQIFENPGREKTRRFIYHLKVFEAVIDGADHDFRGTIGDIESFCFKNQIPGKMVYRIQAAMEELCQQILLSEDGGRQITFTVEYDEQTGSVKIEAAYGGESFDPRDTDNALALSILKSLADSMEYSGDGPSEAPNRFVMTVR